MASSQGVHGEGGKEGGREKKRDKSSSYKGTGPIVFLTFITSSEALSSNIVTLRVRASIYEWLETHSVYNKCYVIKFRSVWLELGEQRGG